MTRHRSNPYIISIHALREEGDVGKGAFLGFLVISIHALREEGDLSSPKLLNSPSPFLSTPSARRATLLKCRTAGCQRVISIHALCEEGDGQHIAQAELRDISIHALCEEGDRPVSRWQVVQRHFYPRPPRGGRPQ